MPNSITNNTRVLSTKIADDAKVSGMGAQELRQLGNNLLSASFGFDKLPAAWGMLENLGTALNMAADEIAANTAGTTPDSGVAA